MADVFDEVLEFYLEHKDPVRRSVRILNKIVTGKARQALVTRKAKQTRNDAKKAKSVPAGQAQQRERRAIPNRIKHKVITRDQGRCTYGIPYDTVDKIQSESRCKNTRWTELHHKIPIHLGGIHSEENITVLCADHHKLIHHESRNEEGSKEVAAKD